MEKAGKFTKKTGTVPKLLPQTHEDKVFQLNFFSNH
jgi:hypothetical protein